MVCEMLMSMLCTLPSLSLFSLKCICEQSSTCVPVQAGGLMASLQHGAQEMRPAKKVMDQSGKKRQENPIVYLEIRFHPFG